MRRVFMVILASLLVAAFLAGMGWAPQETAAVRVLVGFKGAPDPAVIAAADGKVEYVYNVVPVICALVPTPAVEGLRNHPAVKYVEFDGACHALAQIIPWGVMDVGAHRVWATGNKGDNVNVAVLDTGIDLDHPDLTVMGGYDFVNGDAIPDDDHGHGTHVAGIIAALDNTVGVVGVAPLAHLYAVKVLNASGSGSISTLAMGIDWCVTNHMNVINMSLGSTSGSTTLRTACENAWNAGLILVAATSDGMVYPGGYPSVIPVAPLDQNNARGLCGGPVELSAPGTAYSTWGGGGYITLGGYSVAPPHVAGVACLVKSAHPEHPNTAIRSALHSTAIDLGAVGWDTCYGYGLVWAPGAVDYPVAER